MRDATDAAVLGQNTVTLTFEQAATSQTETVSWLVYVLDLVDPVSAYTA